MKRCSRCKTTKGLAEFYLGKHGPSGYCRKCSKANAAEWRLKNRKRRNRTQREWIKRNEGYRKHMEVKRRYGISWEEWEALLALQENRCAACRPTWTTIR